MSIEDISYHSNRWPVSNNFTGCGDRLDTLIDIALRDAFTRLRETTENGSFQEIV